MFDVFYLTTKPNLFPHEIKVNDIDEARSMSRTRFFWIVDHLTDYTNWDWLWEPTPWESHQRHTWASQHQVSSGTYLIPTDGYTDTNYHSRPLLTKNSGIESWEIPDGIDVNSFDFTWHPDDRDPPYIYQFGTQHQPTGGPRYVVNGATDVKYVPSITANRTIVDDCWIIPEGIDVNSFDFTWHPDDRDPPYIYQFGTQHQPTGGPRYVVNGATTIKYVSSPHANRTIVDDCWIIPEHTNLDSFDFTWHPDDRDPPYIYQFGTQWSRGGGPTYTVNLATEIKYVTTQIAKMLPTSTNWEIPTGIDLSSFDFSWTPDSTDDPYIYQFGTQHQKTGGPRYIVPSATEVKYIKEPRAIKASTDDSWEIPDGAEIESFDFTWHPDDTEEPYIYQFGTQHQKTGGPRYIVRNATDIKYVDQIKIQTQRVATALYEIDHLDGNSGNIADTTKISRYFDNYLDTLKRIAKNIPREHEFVWICSSICDYTDFDFTWHPEQWQATMLHVFPSDGEKFGDTFFMHVPTFQYRIDRCELLEWYDLNFVEDISVPRRPIPVIHHDNDSHVEAIRSIEWKGPLALFTQGNPTIIPSVPLWREKTKAITPISLGAESVIVPRNAITHIKEQVYDYQYVDKSHYYDNESSPMDIVFLSNGESCADENWDHLLTTVPSGFRVIRIDKVEGRVQSEQAAATASTTRWYYRVPAKLKVAEGFNWRWQPDRLQQAKHYIFHARNPINDLEYGHMATIAFNKSLVLQTTGEGLDFAMDKLHEVVPILSGTANYSMDSWIAWRTAFRECLKLRHSLPDVESEWRLNQWMTVDKGTEISEWSRIGARDAITYYESTGGDFDKLKQSYEWDWLGKHLIKTHNITPRALQ
jgi:hypothetical protein